MLSFARQQLVVSTNLYGPKSTRLPGTSWLVLLLASVMAVSGCSRVEPEAKRIVGTWSLAAIEDLAGRIEGESPDDFRPTEAKMQVTFESGGGMRTVTRVNTIDSEKRGSWTFRHFDAATQTLELDCELMGQATPCEIEFLSADEIKLVPPNMAGTTTRLTFRRK
jgi:hypothetical protein